ncbi:MAG TPA: hypothetical protein VFR85_11860 [Anaeromyxobacteraceae bacterium]|nr:hypothetical protein [Anaeromyxobacteraceae bacterium]
MPATHPEQLRLFGFDARSAPRAVRLEAASHLADSISELLGERVRLAVHDNRSTMVSFRRAGGAVCYRVHHLFLRAPGEVVRALAAFASPRLRAGRRREAGRRIDAWVRQNRAAIAPLDPGSLRARGRHHDLSGILKRLNAEHFGGAVRAAIGWGRGGAGADRRSIKTGVYLHDARAIRVHPALDRAQVPEFYVAAVVFHEMLHQVVPGEERGGRRVVHGPEFRRRERAYPDHARAREWEKRNLDLLLGRVR